MYNMFILATYTFNFGLLGVNYIIIMMIISISFQDLVSIDSRETAQLILKVFAHSLADIVRKLEVSSKELGIIQTGTCW